MIITNNIYYLKVRYAACNAIGQMSTDFAPIFEKKFHENVVPGLLMLLDDNANPRVQAHAGIFIQVYNLSVSSKELFQALH